MSSITRGEASRLVTDRSRAIRRGLTTMSTAIAVLAPALQLPVGLQRFNERKRDVPRHVRGLGAPAVAMDTAQRIVTGLGSQRNCTSSFPAGAVLTELHALSQRMMVVGSSSESKCQPFGAVHVGS